MRALLLLGIVAVLLVCSLMVPQIGVYAYIWFSLFRPDIVAFGSRTFAYSEWLAIALMVGSFRMLPNAPKAWFLNPVTISLLLLEIPVAISCNVGDHVPDTAYSYSLFVRMSLVLLLIPLVITKVEELKRLFIVTAVSLGIWGFWHGTTGVLHGGLRIYDGIGGFMNENNTFACGLVMVIPFCWYSRLLVKSLYMKLAMQALTWGSVACTVLTFSRGAAVALAFILLVMVMQSKRKMMAVLAIVLIGLGPAVYLVGDRYFNRMSTIATYDEDQSAMSRIVVMKAALDVWGTHPFLGVGMGSESFINAAKPFVEGTIGQNLVVHNSYLQMLAECGIFGFLLYMYMIFAVIWRAWRSSRRLLKSNPDYAPYPRAILLSMIAYVICSLTQPRYSFDFLYMIVMYAAAWYNIEKELPQPVTQTVATVTPFSVPGALGRPRVKSCPTAS